MGIEIYRSLERAIERECRESAARIVAKELKFYSDSLATDKDSEVLVAFRAVAIATRARSLEYLVRNEVIDAATARLRKILNEAGG